MDRIKNILITGKSGYIAKSLYRELSSKYDVTCIGRDTLDLTNSIDTRVYMRDKHFDVIIHTAVSGGSRLRKDNYLDMDINLSMYYNLLQNKLSYDKLIHFGSGAELYMSDEPYGLSKKVIARSIEEINNFYNLRVFAVFDENELDTRFIKSCINKYINKEDMQVYEYKYMVSHLALKGNAYAFINRDARYLGIELHPSLYQALSQQHPSVRQSID